MRVRLLALFLLIAEAGAMTVAVDQPASWYDLAASHHEQHAAGGAAIGAAGYGAAALVTSSRGRRIATGFAAGLAIGAAYELARASDGSALADPVDAAWTGAGALLGAALADLTGRAIGLAVRREDGGTTVAVSLAIPLP